MPVRLGIKKRGNNASLTHCPSRPRPQLFSIDLYGRLSVTLARLYQSFWPFSTVSKYICKFYLGFTHKWCVIVTHYVLNFCPRFQHNTHHVKMTPLVDVLLQHVSVLIIAHPDGLLLCCFNPFKCVIKLLININSTHIIVN